jgi:hypothetical protein
VKRPGVGPQFRVGTVTAGRSLKIKNLTVENKNRQGDSACRGMAPKRASKQQQQLNVDQFKLLKKPMDHLGKQINVPGSFWQGRMLPEERDKVYKCTIVDFSLAHKFAPDSSPRMAFKMQEMGIDGTGSHEASDLASTMYWIDYPMPFLSFYYDTFPAVDDILAGAAEVASLARARGNGFNDSASNGCASSATVSHTDVHPEFPSLRIPSAVDGDMVKIQVDGDMVKIHNFSEAFPHHVDLLWLRVRGLSISMISSDEFREFVRDYEPRASFPHHSTINHIAEAVQALQADERKFRISNLAKEFKGLACVGLQLDMWTDTITHTAYGCVTMTTIRDPTDAKADNAQLQLCSEILSFNVFPVVSKTGEAIKAWFISVLEDNQLPHSIVAGVTPDGAADGQCGLAKIETIAEKVDTCMLHVLQRAVLFSIGIAGASSKNPAAKSLLRANNRVVQLSRQSLAVGKSISNAQVAANVPHEKVLSLVKTATTRWGNQYSQLSTNIRLRRAIDPAVDKFKRENRNNKEAIVEENESDQGSKVGRPVPAVDLGLTTQEWEDTREMEAFLSYSFDIKETIEKRPYCTGAQAIQLLYDLKENFCDPDAGLIVREFPSTLSIQDRELRNDKSTFTTKESDYLCSAVTTARKVLRDELNARVFHGSSDLRPSNARLIQAYMSKQMSSKDYLPSSWNEHARTLYLKALRDAVSINPTPLSPQHGAKKQKVAPSGLSLFRGALLKQSSTDSSAYAAADEEAVDTVLDELKRWEDKDLQEYSKYIAEDGLLNEFKMMWELRESFPLHFTVFKQTACHLSHEANVEQVFSRAGLLADPNLLPAHLSTLVTVGFNRNAFKPQIAAIKDKYYEMFRNKTKS